MVEKFLIPFLLFASWQGAAQSRNLNELAENETEGPSNSLENRPRFFSAQRFRVEFTDYTSVHAGNGRGDRPPHLDRSIGVRVGPDSEYFPYYNSSFQGKEVESLRKAELLIAKLKNFPRQEQVKVCVQGFAIVDDEKCAAIPDDVPVEEIAPAIPKPFTLEGAHNYKLYQIKSFTIDVWKAHNGKLMAQFSGDDRGRTQRLFSRFGLPTHLTLGIHEYLPGLRGFELADENLDVFQNFLNSYKAYLLDSRSNPDARFLVCAKPFKKVWEKPYWEDTRQILTYVMFPAVYCK